MKLLDPDSRLYQILSTAAGFIALNILWLLCSAPLVTAGAATAAMYTVTRKMARHEDPTVLPDFWKALKANFKQGLLASLILLLPLLLLVLYLLLGLSSGTAGHPLLRGLSWLAAGIIGVFASYLWPLLAWYENSLGNTLRNAALLPLSNPLIALAVTALNLLPLYLLLRHTAFFLRVSFLWLAAGFALTAFVNTKLLLLQFQAVHAAQAEEEEPKDAR